MLSWLGTTCSLTCPHEDTEITGDHRGPRGATGEQGGLRGGTLLGLSNSDPTVWSLICPSAITETVGEHV